MASERLTRDLVDDMVRTLRENADTHIVLSASLLPPGGGWPRVRIEGKMIYLDRYLWLRLTGEEPPAYMRGQCYIVGCANPFHRRETKPRRDKSPTVRLHSHCRQGHRLTEANRYYWTDREGRRRSRCRTCQLDRQRAYDERKRRERATDD